ncbi:uncharacterized protein MONOS_8423 [Monocercomonoides exilis]|uniref:uncharacterized protein n=1 Tax=Monocercomonoides exilis TaxID=2049356 RepID=UPI00355972C4|nr:hypothetical protein MONOS_8423 [Monocercomonoides exilis]|eukprot:MONOS_8423.1-p1 / transcript=MONOS_8423.1 / gene=MONOS_8423 / organism=Monocercomonoides_exilis_PA203 / gene_product=unspecified product / transcript_product=unspecified product / location=Mono_scaffold00317:16494-16991(-) / protein_length=166 / sequence_SO=supercontig / SO=protein_coding / is_pseudo=false
MDLPVNAIHIPGERNIAVEALSQTVVEGDYEITAREQKEAEQAFEAVHIVDAFANRKNKRCVTWYGPGSPWCKDGLAADWGRDVVLLHPPIPLIVPCLKKARAEKTRAIILLPAWKNQVWSQLFEEMETHRVVWKDAKKVLLPGEELRRTGASLPPCRYMAVRLN